MLVRICPQMRKKVVRGKNAADNRRADCVHPQVLHGHGGQRALGPHQAEQRRGQEIQRPADDNPLPEDQQAGDGEDVVGFLRPLFTQPHRDRHGRADADQVGDGEVDDDERHHEVERRKTLRFPRICPTKMPSSSCTARTPACPPSRAAPPSETGGWGWCSEIRFFDPFSRSLHLYFVHSAPQRRGLAAPVRNIGRHLSLCAGSKKAGQGRRLSLCLIRLVISSVFSPERLALRATFLPYHNIPPKSRRAG